jgi:putative transposase
MPLLYETSLSDEAWEVIEPIFRRTKTCGRPNIYRTRSVVDAIFYTTKNGCVWRCLPNDFPPWKTVYGYFRKWSISGLWECLNQALTSIVRVCLGREETPSLVSIDSQSQSAEPGIKDRGLDGGKKVNGRKRHIIVDTLGLLMFCMCTAANQADSQAGKVLIEFLNDPNRFPRLKKVLGDNSYRNVGSNLKVPISVEISERKAGQKGFVPQAFRWVVERTFAWLNRNRRLVRNYEKSVEHQQSMNYLANIRLCIRKFEKCLIKSNY